MHIKRKRKLRILKVFQKSYVEKILSNFNRTFSVAVSADFNVKFIKITDRCKKNVESFSYREDIDSLMFLMMITRSDLAFIVNVLNQIAEKSNKNH